MEVPMNYSTKSQEWQGISWNNKNTPNIDIFCAIVGNAENGTCRILSALGIIFPETSARE